MKIISRSVLSVLCGLLFLKLSAQDVTVFSPNKQLTVTITVTNGQPFYSVSYNNKVMLENSPLGLKTNEGDFSAGLNYINREDSTINKTYTQAKIKKSQVHYVANQLTCNFENAMKHKIKIVFRVSDNDIAFRYELAPMGQRFACVVEKEATGYKFPAVTTTFLSPMMAPMTGYARTAPSYESGYQADASMTGANSRGEGFVFPGLFHVGDNGWVLLSETGVSSLYCGAHLSDCSKETGVYTVEYPNPKQNNGFGSTGAAITLPGITPWRTITVGENLKPIVETTIPFDVLEPLYEPSRNYKFGKATWSWIVWQDASMNYDDQVKYIDLAAALKWEYILIDAFWDTNIGKERMKELIKYAKSKKVEVLLWYNSNGAENDAPQGPRNKMNTSVERKKEMQWLRDAGVKGLKVDFFGGDKQETMRLYEDILSDANDYGLFIDFHGATLPRGWERMYPNFIGSEAVLASEMLIFSQGVRDAEAFNATLHPFIRNTVGSMEFGGVLLNKFLTKSNQNRNKRLTTDAFQLATAVLFQNPVQMFGLTPNNLTDVPAFEIEFMKKVPTNAGKEVLKLTLKLPMVAGKKMRLYNDDANKAPYTNEVSVGAGGKYEIEIQPGGGFVLQQ
jgi:Glycoside hydrolase 97/Glycosyl-hydrolase 97 N-terminal